MEKSSEKVTVDKSKKTEQPKEEKLPKFEAPKEIKPKHGAKPLSVTNSKAIDPVDKPWAKDADEATSKKIEAAVKKEEREKEQLAKE